MKRILSLIFSIFALFLFASCAEFQDGHSDVSSTENPSDISSGETQATDPPTWTHEAALTRFLTDTNRNGKVADYDSQVPPGTLPLVEHIPAAEQSLVGATVQIIFAQEQQAIHFYFCCDSKTQFERLAVIVDAERIPMLLVFETNLGGITGLSEKIATETAFGATILSVTNISFEEGSVYAYNACITACEGQNNGVFPEATSSGEYLGIVGTDDFGNAVCTIAGTDPAHITDEMRHDIDVWFRIFQRFNLVDLMSSDEAH